MIKCDKSESWIRGEGNIILTEYSVLTKALKEHFPESILRDAFEIALMSEEELNKK